MVDRDLADLYGVSTKRLNEQVKRNAERFPNDYMFPLSMEETHKLVAKSDRFKSMKHSSVPMNAFTEHGIIMLAAVLKSKTAIMASVQITNTFVAMRKMLASMAPLLARIEETERRQLESQAKQLSDQAHNEERFEQISQAMYNQEFPPQKVFYEGEVFDADVFITQYVRKAKQSILLIDNWVDIGTLDILSKKSAEVAVTIVTSPKGNHLAESDMVKFNNQYGNLFLVTSRSFHDRFLVIDDNELYLLGASVKDLGKKCFAFARLDASNIEHIKSRIGTTLPAEG